MTSSNHVTTTPTNATTIVADVVDLLNGTAVATADDKDQSGNPYSVSNAVRLSSFVRFKKLMF